jgi:molybdopterin molybdotransferase
MSEALLVSDALARIITSMKPLVDRETVKLSDALGRVLSDDVVSQVDLPLRARSAMDGDALRYPSHSLDELSLPVVGEDYAGRAPTRWNDDIGAMRIFTGAEIPYGFDSVVPQEQVDIKSNGSTITFRLHQLKPQANVRMTGDDLMKGSTALRHSQRIGPRHLALLAAMGCAEVNVIRRPRIALLSTGSELLETGERLGPHQIHDANRPMLAALCKTMNVDLLDLGIVKDDRQALVAKLQEAVDHADLIISSGGVSVGETDHIRSILQELGEVHFWKLAIKPGKPVALGLLRHRHKVNSNRDPQSAPQDITPLIALPGNPVAALVTFEALVRPAIEHLAGTSLQSSQSPWKPTSSMIRARLTHPSQKIVGRTEYLRAGLQRSVDGQWLATISTSQGAANLFSLATADGFVVLHHEAGPLSAGDWVDVLIL